MDRRPRWLDEEDDLEAERIVTKYLGIPEATITSFADWYLDNSIPPPVRKPLPILKNRVTVKPLRKAWEPPPSPPPQQRPKPEQYQNKDPQRTIYRRGHEGGYSYDETDTSRLRGLHYGYDDGSVYVTNPWPAGRSATRSEELDEASIKYDQAMQKLNGHIKNI